MNTTTREVTIDGITKVETYEGQRNTKTEYINGTQSQFEKAYALQVGMFN